jgi:hypothetical protein
MELNDWLAQLSEGLGTADLELDHKTVKLVLDLARDAAHGVERVAAPLTTFLVGVAVGRGQSVTDATASATSLLPPGDQ